eukprot:758580-Hanusia_phi.AAC.1
MASLPQTFVENFHDEDAVKKMIYRYQTSGAAYACVAVEERRVGIELGDVLLDSLHHSKQLLVDHLISSHLLRRLVSPLRSCLLLLPQCPQHHVALRRDLGGTGLKVSALGFGGSALGGVFHAVTEEECTKVVRETLRAGVNIIDTAPWYGQGKSEEMLGKALKGIPRQVRSKRMRRAERGEG